MEFNYQGIEIALVAGIVPKNISYFDDEIPNYSHDPANSRKLKKAMGYDQHRIENKNRTVSDYAVTLFQKLESQGLVEAKQINGLYLVTQTPDYQIPPTSCVIHGRLNLDESVYCVDINDGCAGYIKAINEACMFLNSSDANLVLIVAGDILSSKVSPNDRNSYPLIGDAVTLTIIRKTNSEEKIWINFRTRGSAHDKLIIPAGGLRNPSSNSTQVIQVDEDGNSRTQENLFMHGRDVFAFTQADVPDFILHNLNNKNLQPSDYDRFYFHQANAFILDRLRQKFALDIMKMPDRIIREYGNSSSATIPMLIASEHEQAPMRCVLAGFGVGLQWAMADLTLNSHSFQKIQEF